MGAGECAVLDSQQAHDSLVIAIAESPEEKQRVYRFRYSVYVDEMGKRNLSCADHDRKILTDDLDASATLFYADSGGQLVATLRRNLVGCDGMPEAYRDIYDLAAFEGFAPESLSLSSRLMIAREMRGSPALARLLVGAYEDALVRGRRLDLCNCSPSLVDLYEHLGYRRYKDNFMDPDVGYRVPMALVVRDEAHLEALRSPFLRKLRAHKQEGDQADGTAAWFTERFGASSRVAASMLRGPDFWNFLAEKLRPSPAQRVPLLAGLSEEEAQVVLQKGTVLTCRKGERIVRINDVTREMYVLLTGLIEVRSASGQTSIAVFGPGQIIGEIGCILGCQRDGDVVAVEDSEILVISRAHIERLIANQPDLAARTLMNLSRILCERLAASIRIRIAAEDRDTAT